jgi:hypothetical protein
VSLCLDVMHSFLTMQLWQKRFRRLRAIDNSWLFSCLNLLGDGVIVLFHLVFCCISKRQRSCICRGSNSLPWRLRKLALLQSPRRADVQCRAKMVCSLDDHGGSV